jgi:hypothetical protein
MRWESELPYEPIGYVRKLWAHYALEMKDEELALVAARWQKGLAQACRKIAEEA